MLTETNDRSERMTVAGDPMIEDRRTETATPIGYVVCTDTFLSNWGIARGRSLYALAYHSIGEHDALMIAARGRSDMARPRNVLTLRADGTPRLRMEPGDHLAIVDRGEASEWYRGAAARWNQGA